MSKATAPLERGVQRIQDWVQIPSSATFPATHAMMMALAAILGLYAGLAVGLLANFIGLFQLLFFRPETLWSALAGRDATWTRHFLDALRTAPWHLEFIALAAVGVAATRLVAKLAERKRIWLPQMAQAGRIRAIGWLLGFGLTLYYPLLVLATFNRAFGEVHGGLLALLSTVPAVWRLLAPALGGLGVALLLRHVSPESSGHGVTEVMEAINVRGKRIRTRVAVWKSVTAGLTIGSGGSAGREGPVVQIGGAVANGLAVRFGLSSEQTMLLLACGGAAGIAASFNSPIGGTFFALEILLGDFAMRSMAPVAFAAVAATVTGRALIGAAGEIAHIPFHVASGAEMGPYVMLGALAAVVASLYVRTVSTVEHTFKTHPRLSKQPLEVRLMLGGLLVGLIGLWTPRVLGNGYETMNTALHGELPASVMFVALIGKIAASGFTLGSGAPGGSFFPPVFMGAMLGGTLGTLGHSLLPSLISGPGPYAAVGMAAVVAGATQAPLTAILMLFELTGSYEIILPLMLACTTSVAGAHWWLGGSIYTLKLRSKGIRLKSSGQDPLHQLLVQDVMTRDPVTVRASDTVQEVLRIARERKHSAFPMLNASGQFCGMLRLEHLSSSLADGDRSKPATAEDCALAHPPVAFPGETLEVARQRMQAERTSHLPVIDPSRPGVLLGIISQRDLLNSFDLEAGSRVAVSDGLRAG